ncbi:hypothetical protein N0V90_007769 [Kalmusia sp. IMI 367209]|nr:hypothetical protein N0V90_007769 [Kalmusia sp. IMI 367209]
MLHILLQAFFLALVLADDPNDLSSYTKAVFIPYASKFSSNHTPTISCTIKNKPYVIPVDTGSTGLIIGAPKVPFIPTKAGFPAIEYIAKKELLYTGRFVKISINFLGVNGTKARAEVPAFIVDKSVICSGYKGGDQCTITKENDVGKILHMGIGFGLNALESGSPNAIPSNNPLLNIVSVNGVHVTDKKFRNGYIVSTKGIHIGLTKKNTEEFNWVGLDKGTTSDKHDWAMVKTAFKVDDQGPYPGSAVIDTSIGEMYIQASPLGSLPNATVSDTFHKSSSKSSKSPKSSESSKSSKSAKSAESDKSDKSSESSKTSKKQITVVKKDTKLSFGFPSLGDEGLAGYDFKVGDKKFKSQPTWVEPVTSGKAPFVNTGRKLLWGFTVAFDAVGGRYGFKCLRCGGKESEAKGSGSKEVSKQGHGKWTGDEGTGYKTGKPLRFV